MKNAKKVFAMLLALTMCVGSLAACGDTATTTTDTTPASEAATEAVSEAASEEAGTEAEATAEDKTLVAAVETGNEYATQRAKDYLQLTDEEGYHWGMLRGIWSSVADLAFVQAQDILGLGHEARMNTPSTLGGNWCWRALPGAFDRELAKKLRHVTEIYGRTSFWDVFPEEEPEEDEEASAED